MKIINTKTNRRSVDLEKSHVEFQVSRIFLFIQNIHIKN